MSFYFSQVRELACLHTLYTLLLVGGIRLERMTFCL